MRSGLTKVCRLTQKSPKIFSLIKPLIKPLIAMLYASVKRHSL
jgi:hypothetical protein